MSSLLPNELDRQLAGSDIAVQSTTSLATSGATQKNVRRDTLVLTAARTLTGLESGADVVFNAAAGFTVTLPAPVVGLRFRFLVGVTNTSSNHKIITDAGTTFLKGSVLQAVEDTTPAANPGPKDFLLNGTSHVAITMNGSTTGGLFGTVIEMVCITSTIWLVTGYVKASGTIATPAATS
jgi:hypothetical protein